MLKLYKLTTTQKGYWETWELENGSHMIHWGELGSEGEARIIKPSRLAFGKSKIQRGIDKARSQGFEEVAIDNHAALLIEYVIDGWGDVSDVDKRHRLEDRMNETLGWTGLGHCDGGSIGSGTMEVCCFVVDYEIARSGIASDLVGTEFSDFSRIYDSRG